MLCKQCGAPLEDGALFCANCGAKQEPEQAQPAQPQYQQPAQPQYQQPVQPQYQQPVQPQYQQPAQPQYQQPAQPQYQQPVQPQYQQPVQPQYQQPAAQTVPGYEPPYNVPHHGYVGFGEAIKLFFTNYVNFRNRASKSEFWWGFLFTSLCGMLCWIPYIGWIISVGIMIPSLALTVRRLHDIGMGWTKIFLGLIPIAGAIILLVYAFRPSDGDNPWGPGPYGQAAPQAVPYNQTPNYPNQ